MHCVILLVFIIGDEMSSRGGDRAINTWFIPQSAGTEEVEWLEVSAEQENARMAYIGTCRLFM